MKTPLAFHDSGSWLDGSGPHSDVVISSRIRLARNISGFHFFSQADAQQQIQVHELIRKNLMETELKNKIWYLNVEEISTLERQLLTERHLISRPLAEQNGSRGVAIAHDELFTLMINEEDHLRIQALASGLKLHETYESINHVDNLLEEKMEFSFSSTFGYLTACPTNVGTGIRVSVMMHLPALKLAGHMEKVLNATRDLNLAVRGLYGEGSEPIGDFFQISNQTTLGKTEKQIIDDLINQAVEPIIEYERKARQKFLDEKPTVLDDKVFRALGTMQNARLISSDETLYLLSYVRLGICLGRIKNIRLENINKLLVITQPAHLQNLYQQKLETVERDQVRAELIRKHLH